MAILSVPGLKQNRIYTDLDLMFGKHMFTNDVMVKVNNDAIKQSLSNLILTRNYERPFHPEIGCQITSLLFEPFNEFTANVIKRTIFSVVEKFEPRVILNEVIVGGSGIDDNEITVTLHYTIRNIDTPQIYDITFYRNR